MILHKATLVCLVAAGLAAQRQKPAKSTAWPCVEGRPVDASQVLAAEVSGGHVMMLHPSEIEHTAALVTWRWDHRETIFRGYGKLDGVREITFPVDTTVESLLVAASLQCRSSVTFHAPAGSELKGEQIDYRAGRMVVVRQPEPGNYRIRLAGQGTWLASVQARSAIHLEAGGGEPSIVGPVGVVRFTFAGPTGDAIEKPSVGSYRIAAEGSDSRGFPFRRLHAPLMLTRSSPP